MANFDAAYDQFEITKVAKLYGRKSGRTDDESGIIRNRRKIEGRSAMPKKF